MIGATTENPYFSLNTPLLSRCLLLRLEPLDGCRQSAAVAGASDPDRGLGRIELDVTDDAIAHLVSIAGGDARMALTGLEAAAQPRKRPASTAVTLEVTADAVQRRPSSTTGKATPTTT